MDALPIFDAGGIELPLRGIKRKAMSTISESAKRARGNNTPTDYGSDASDYNSDSSCDVDGDNFLISSVATPLTPLSPKASPRHPSDLLKIHRCTYEGCDKSFNRPAKLAQHVRSHTNTRPFVCPHALCTKDFLRESHLKHHVKSAHSNVREYICEWEGCGKSFVTATRLKRHHAAHEGREKFRCTVGGCGQTFRKHGTLQKHILTVHEGKKPFICEVLDFDGIECGVGFDTEGQMKSHTGRVHESNSFLCTICSPECRSTTGDPIPDKREASFSTHAALREHVESEHPPACAECGQVCKSLRDLKSHLEVLHGGFDVNDLMTHFCPEQGCGRGFTKKGNLSMHIQISHNQNRFVCGGIDPSTLSQVANWDGSNSCGKPLTTKASLEEHIRTAHQGLAPSRKTKRQTKHGVSDEPARKHQVSVLTRLTGAGYKEESGRYIPCLVLGCSHRFLREYDLEIHLQSRHGLADLGVRKLLMDQEGLCSRQTLQGTSTYATKQDVDAERVLDMQFDDDVGVVDHEETPRVGASKGGDFWLAGRSHHDVGESGEWLRDELEMRCLIDEGLTMERYETVDGQEVDVIDPTLR
ncbi:hypothetical protein HO133_004579 [Letharia lupina]|uniref:C2H2-type domain-containing protein n=1 Tax=Letharia lupina TaxID=560253 RepID=A0A8H6FKK7_9LECA|nr:uncharacterized protein HO133_004579 [Letharia lupina]KAF6230239.1 hypothetical protein HO133_004579 [Letharia lupina]